MVTRSVSGECLSQLYRRVRVMDRVTSPFAQSLTRVLVVSVADESVSFFFSPSLPLSLCLPLYLFLLRLLDNGRTHTTQQSNNQNPRETT